MAMRFFLRLQRTESEPAPCNVCTLRKDLAILTRDRTTSIIYILIIFAVSKIHVILGTAITMIGKAFSLHLRSSQRRSERKKNAIAAFPTSIDNDYTTPLTVPYHQTFRVGVTFPYRHSTEPPKRLYGIADPQWTLALQADTESR